MGCCLTCCDESKSQSGETDERTRLISDPVINSSDGQRIPSESFVSPYQHSLSTKSDEQSMLNKILQQAAINVIDISTLGPHMMEQNEYLERRSAYTSKIDSVNHLWHFNRLPNHNLLKNVSFPEQVFSENAINYDDYILITQCSSKIRDALKFLKVIHTEDLVVPFHIPQKRMVTSTTPTNSLLSQNSEMPVDQN